MLTFPRGLLPTSRIGWRLWTPGEDLPANLAGRPQRLITAGGPLWILTLDQIIGRGREGRLALNALMGALQGGTPILMRPCECRLAPLGDGFSLGASPASAGSPFDDTLAGEATPIVAAFVDDYARRETTLETAVTAGARPLREGDQFGVEHDDWGPRMHRLIRDNGDGSFDIRPPLRAAVSADQAVDYNRPGCVMRLEGRFEIDPVVRHNLYTARATFVELERPLS